MIFQEHRVNLVYNRVIINTTCVRLHKNREQPWEVLKDQLSGNGVVFTVAALELRVDDWTITIYNDDAHDTRQAIVDWQNLCHGMTNEITGAAPAEYKKQAVVRQFHRDGKTVTKEVTIYGLWPTNVGEVQMDWDSNNEVETFESTFAIDWWE